jgi:hypothetical protein
MAREYLDVLVEENQNLRDVCLQVYGSLDYLLKFARENGLGDGVNENIRPGQKLVYEKLSPLKDFDSASVQQIYKDREIRVVTGEVNTRPVTDGCNIPEGYVLLSLRFTALPKKVFYLYLSKGACLSIEYAATFAFYGVLLSNLCQAAYLFSQWINSYYGNLGIYALNENEGVNIYIPKSYADCGTPFFMCVYFAEDLGSGLWTENYGSNNFQEILEFANPFESGGYTRCCSTLTDIDESYNQSTK